MIEREREKDSKRGRERRGAGEREEERMEEIYKRKDTGTKYRLPEWQTIVVERYLRDIIFVDSSPQSNPLTNSNERFRINGCGSFNHFTDGDN